MTTSETDQAKNEMSHLLVSDDSFTEYVSNIAKAENDGNTDRSKSEGSHHRGVPDDSFTSYASIMSKTNGPVSPLSINSVTSCGSKHDDKKILAQETEGSPTCSESPSLHLPKSNMTMSESDEKTDRAKKEMSHLLVSDHSFTSYVSKNEISYPLRRTVSNDSFTSFVSIMSKSKTNCTGTADADGAKRETLHRPISPSFTSHVSKATEKHRSEKTDETKKETFYLPRRFSDSSFTSYVSKDKNIFVQQSRMSSQPPPSQPSKSNMTLTQSKAKSDGTKRETFQHHLRSFSETAGLAFTPLLSKMDGSNTSRLKGQKSIPHKELSSRNRTMNMYLGSREEMDKEQNQNEELIVKLSEHVGILVVDEIERKKLFNHWEYEATRLSMKCHTSGKSIQEMLDWKAIQWERITFMSKQEKLPAPGVEVKGGKHFAHRASLDPSFKASLERAATSAKNMNEQIRAEAKIEIVAIAECLAMRAKEKVELNKELVTMKTILESTYQKKANTEHLLYELSCRKCIKHTIFVGKTTDIKTTTQKHFDQVVKAVQAARKNKIFTIEPQDNSWRNESWSSKSAQHFAQHWLSTTSTSCLFFPCIPNKVSEADILEFCQEYVKVEILVLGRQGVGTELYWEEWRERLQDEAWGENGNAPLDVSII